MSRVSLSLPGGIHHNLIVTEKETVNDILRYFNINPETKIVYRNGKILSREKMEKQLPSKSTIYLSVKDKVVR